MPRKRFEDKHCRGGIIGLIFPYSITRSGLLIRALAIALVIGLPVRLTYKFSEKRAHELDAEATPIMASIENLESKTTSEHRRPTQAEIRLSNTLISQLKPYPKKMYTCGIMMAICLGISAVQYILSIWMLVIPRLRDMGQSIKLAWLMIIPGPNVILPWFLILAPSR